jgi:hypothetical protein
VPLHPGALKILHAQPGTGVVECLRERMAEDFVPPSCLVELAERAAHAVTGFSEVAAIVVLGLRLYSRHAAGQYGSDDDDCC